MNDADRAAVERLAHELRVALSIVPTGHWGTWRGNAERALLAARERGLLDD